MPRRIGLKRLVDVCRRTATSHEAGLDARTIWEREARQGPPLHQRQFSKVHAAILEGDTLTDALSKTGDYLPALVRDMVYVGEQTGRLEQVLDRLAAYYDHLRVLRGSFLAAIAWPLLQLTIAVLLIGAVIWLRGFLPGDHDMVGLGLSGTSGALIYFSWVGLLIVGGFCFLRSLVQGRLSAVLMTPMMRLPVVGTWLQLMAMSRLTWALGLSVGSGMPAQDCARVGLRSTQNRYFTQHTSDIVAEIRRGESMHDAFASTEVFSQDFLDAVHVGEETGRLSESMDTLSKRYEQQGKVAMQGLTVAGGVAVWLLVAAIIIYFIFKFALFYVGLYDDLLSM